MIHKIYSVYDTKAEVYSLPYYMNNEPSAIRTFSDWVNNKETPYGKHPEDYILFSCGELDDSTGTITQDKISSIGNGLQFIIQENEQ